MSNRISFGKVAVVLLLLFTVFMPGAVFATTQDDLNAPQQGQSCAETPPYCGPGLRCEAKKCVPVFENVGGLITLIERIMNIALAILLVLVVVMLVWGSIEFVTSAGEEKAVSSARSKMLYAVIGLVLALIAAGVPPLIRSIVGA